MVFYSQYNVSKANECVNFKVGQPNNKVLPLNLIKHSMNKLIKEEDRKEILQYSQIPGYKSFRENLSKWLSERYNSSVDPNELFCVQGITGGLHLYLSLCARDGDVIFVEDPSYFLAINIFREMNLNVEMIPMTENGLDINVLKEKLEKYKSNERMFLYTIPFYHNPTGISMNEDTKNELSQICNNYSNLRILSDEVYHFLGFKDETSYPLADYHPNIITFGTFSKILAPSLRVGYIYCSNKFKDNNGVIDKLCGCGLYDSSGGLNTINHYLVNNLLEEDLVNDYINKCRSFLKERCEALSNELQKYNFNFTKPDGGYFIWIDLGFNAEKFLNFCNNKKINFHLGIKFGSKSYENFIRLSFSYYDPDELILGVERLYKAYINYNKKAVCVHGATGKLGTLIVNQLKEHKDFYYLDNVNRDYNFNSSMEFLIDVSTADGTNNLLKHLLKENVNVPLLIGTTGNLDYNLIHQYSLNNPVGVYNNFSIGINKIKSFVKNLNLDDSWKIYIKEIHHQHKIDKPSGTAIGIKELINSDIDIISERVGEVFGKHMITFENEDEKLEIIHEAKTRDIFAKGCISRINELSDKKSGLFGDIEFKKLTTKTLYSGSGNKLLIVENFKDLSKQDFTLLESDKDSTLDGVIFLEDNYWEYFNRDGSKVDFCGNGARCVAKHLSDRGVINPIKIGDIEVKYHTKENKIFVELPKPSDLDISHDIVKEIREFFDSMDIIGLDDINIYKCGVPHLIIETTEDILSYDTEIINMYGNSIKDIYEKYDSEGININFVYYNHELDNILSVRTFERGVDRETECCGSGSMCSYKYYCDTYSSSDDEMIIRLSNGKELVAYCDKSSDKYYLSGEVERLNYLSEEC